MDKEIKSVFLILFVIMAVIGLCNGAVYKVGDSAGWTVIGNVDYHNWASSKTFQVGDNILFKYDPLYHNVLEVSRSDFHTCDPTSPIATHTTGNDSIIIRRPGHYYYICGILGHCQAGQKVDIRVPRSAGPSAVPPALGPVQPADEEVAPIGSPYGPLAPDPSYNGGESVFHSDALLCLNMARIGLFLFLIRILY